PTTSIDTLSLHDALPIFTGERSIYLFGKLTEVRKLPVTKTQHRVSQMLRRTKINKPGHKPPGRCGCITIAVCRSQHQKPGCLRIDRKSTRLNSSHVKISY